MLLFLPYLILRRRWTAAATMAFIILLVVVASILWLGTELHRTWLRDYVIGFGARPLAAYNVQSISGALARLVAPGHYRLAAARPCAGLRVGSLRINRHLCFCGPGGVRKSRTAGNRGRLVERMESRPHPCAARQPYPHGLTITACFSFR